MTPPTTAAIPAKMALLVLMGLAALSDLVEDGAEEEAPLLLLWPAEVLEAVSVADPVSVAALLEPGAAVVEVTRVVSVAPGAAVSFPAPAVTVTTAKSEM